MTICGAILAGGQSRRFGRDKAEAEVDGKRLIDLVAKAMAPQVDALVVCGREDPDYMCLEDRPRQGIGPLGGLLAALSFAGESNHAAILSAGCDAPGLPNDLLVQLDGKSPSIVESQPVIGFWPTGLSSQLDEFIANGGRSLYGFAEHVSARSVRLKAPLANINRPEDLENYTG